MGICKYSYDSMWGHSGYDLNVDKPDAGYNQRNAPVPSSTDADAATATHTSSLCTGAGITPALARSCEASASHAAAGSGTKQAPRRPPPSWPTSCWRSPPARARRRAPPHTSPAAHPPQRANRSPPGPPRAARQGSTAARRRRSRGAARRVRRGAVRARRAARGGAVALDPAAQECGRLGRKRRRERVGEEQAATPAEEERASALTRAVHAGVASEQHALAPRVDPADRALDGAREDVCVAPREKVPVVARVRAEQRKQRQDELGHRGEEVVPPRRRRQPRRAGAVRHRHLCAPAVVSTSPRHARGRRGAQGRGGAGAAPPPLL